MYPPFDRPLSPTSSRKTFSSPISTPPYPNNPRQKVRFSLRNEPPNGPQQKKKPVPRPSSKMLELVSLIDQPRGEKKKKKKNSNKKIPKPKERERETLLLLLPPPSIEDDGSKASAKRSVEIFSPLRVRRNSYLAPVPPSTASIPSMG